MRMKAKVAGYFVLQRRSAGGILLEEVAFKNLITNRGLDLIGEGNSFFSYVHLSSSTATPAVTDTTMGGTVVRTAAVSPIFPNSDVVAASAPYTATHLRGWRFAAGVAVGTWSSIGIGPSNSDSNIICKTRIRDGGGTPTSITVLAGEVLDVRYEFRTEIDTADITGTVASVGYTIRPYGVAQAGTRTLAVLSAPTCNVYAANGSIALAAITATSPFVNAQLFTGGSGLNGTLGAYTTGSYSRSWTLSLTTTVTHASNTIRGISLSWSGLFGLGWQILFNSPGFTKTNLQTASIVGTISWARA